MSRLDQKIAGVLRPLLEQRGIAVDKIVIFGSYAKKSEKEDSDIDLIIVSKGFRNKSVFERIESVTGVGRTLVKTFKKPFDLMFYSDLEWDDSQSIVVNAAREEGKILHDSQSF